MLRFTSTIYLLVLSIFLMFIPAGNLRAAAPAGNLKTPSATIPPTDLNNQLKLEMMKRYAALSLKEYETLTGKKLNFFQRTVFKMNQRRMKNTIAHYDGDGPNVLSKISWFFKGVLLGPLAVLLAYILFKDEERELIKWTWFGFATWPVFLAVYFIFFANK